MLQKEMVPGLISIMPVFTVESFSPESFLILVETPQCSQECLCLPGLNSETFQMWGEWDNHCTAKAPIRTHKEKKTKPINTGARWEKGNSATTTTATGKICFSLGQPWVKRHRAAENYSTTAPKDSVSSPELRITGISIWQPAICQWSL